MTTVAVGVVLLAALLVPVGNARPPSAEATARAPAVMPGLVGIDLARPRLLLRSADIPTVQDRLGREPYRTVLHHLTGRIDGAPAPNQADQADCVQTGNRNREGAKAKAAKDLAFLYTIDRTWDAGTNSVITPDAVSRQAMGDKVRDYLRFMCTESRIKINPDRDINTSHELEQYAVAYDTLAGGGYDFAGAEQSIIDNLAALTSEFYSHYAYPNEGNVSVAQSIFLLNNHRSKGAAAIGTAALALADYTAPPGADSRTHDPKAWLDFALDRIDLVQRWTYGAPDGAYGEGTHYWRFAAINLLPFLRAWNGLYGNNPWTTSNGVTVPDLWRHPQTVAMQRWMMDLTKPDTTLAAIDDANVGERMWFGAFPGSYEGAEWMSWAWQRSAPHYETDASIDMAADQIVTFDDGVTPSPPHWSPTSFWPDGGNAVFRSSWTDPDARHVVVQGEHGSAREFGVDRRGIGELGSAPHDHADPGSWQLHAYGERLMLDPGYKDYDHNLQWVMNKPSDHNMILVGPTGQPGESPDDPLTATWNTGSPFFSSAGQAPPGDGNAQISETLDSPFIDASTVHSTYGKPDTDKADVRRRFLFVDDTYLVISDDVHSPVPRTYTWPLHGNGGGSAGTTAPLSARSAAERPPLGAPAVGPLPFDASGGTFTATATGAQWDRPNARVTVGMSFAGATAPRSTATDLGLFEDTRESLGQYQRIRLSVPGTDVGALSIAYPSPSSAAAPVITEVGAPGGTGLVLDASSSDRRSLVVKRATGSGVLSLPPAHGFDAVETDGATVVIDTHADGSLRVAYAEDATFISYGGVTHLRSTTGLRGTIGLRLPDQGRAEVVADNTESAVAVHGLPFTPTAIDGGCGIADVADGTASAQLNRNRRFTLRATSGNGTPAADAGPAINAATGPVTLDGRASCDPDGDGLAASWRVTSAPPGSDWKLSDPSSFTPDLDASVAGQYRVRLVVTDSTGASSLESEVVVVAGSASPPTTTAASAPVPGGGGTGPRAIGAITSATVPRVPRFTG